MLRFVLLYHDCPPTFTRPSHWDFMLEHQGELLTWALTANPTSDAAGGSTVSKTVSAVKLANHRLAYLEYEGPVSGDRGHVVRVAAGAYFWLERMPTRLRMRLAGATLTGEAILTHEEGDAWNFSWQRNERA